MNLEIISRQIQSDYAIKLAKPAIDYLINGLSIFHDYQRMRQYRNPQVATGNLSISIELMIKAYIAHKNLFLLLKGLPIEAKLLLICPSQLPSSFNPKIFEIDFKEGTFSSVEFDECVSLLYAFNPELRRNLQSHFRYIAKTRNASVHSFVPSIHNYEVERIAYTALKTYEALSKDEPLIHSHYAFTEKDSRFLSHFDANRIECVQKAIENAKLQAKKVNENQSFDFSGYPKWDFGILKCPVCESKGIAVGETEIAQGAPDQFGELPEPSLWFYPDSFHCDECGLQLNDYQELVLAGVVVDDQSQCDRTEDMDEFLQWKKEN